MAPVIKLFGATVDCFIVSTEDCLTVILLNFDSYSEIYFEDKVLPILVRGKPNLQWLKFTMVTTEMVSSADNTARGFLPVTEGSLAAGQDALSSQVLKNIISSK